MYRRSVYTSTRLQSETRGDVAFDVNVRMVLLAHELGMGYAALRKISKVLGIHSLHLKTYQRHDKRVTGRLWKQGWYRDVDFGGLMTCYILWCCCRL